MKIPAIEQIRHCDQYTIEHGISSLDLMEQAAGTCSQHLTDLFSQEETFEIYCGMGNNGGDGLVVARHLLSNEYRVKVIVLKHKDNFSDDCLTNYRLLKEKFPQNITIIENEQQLPAVESTVVVDAILGSGLNHEIDHPLITAAIKNINKSNAFVFSIDVPSGFFADRPTPEKAIAVEADYTHSLAFPKLGFMFPENYRYVGEWDSFPIGLHPQCIADLKTDNFCITNALVSDWKIVRKKFDHKNCFGHGLLIAGSKSMMGAAVLAAKSALRSGIGLLTVHVPQIGYSIMQTTVNEAICDADDNENVFTDMAFKHLSKFNAIAIGPGLGTDRQTAQGLKKLIADFGGSFVFDADAINILADNKTWLEFIPPKCIFTPHIKEFERLTKKVSNSFERMKLQKEFSFKHNAIVVLKGAHTCVSLPNGQCFFNMNGHPCLATAGSGDVLTGIILSLLCQGMKAEQAAIMGVYMHAQAANHAMLHQSEASLIATDIIENLKFI